MTSRCCLLALILAGVLCRAAIGDGHRILFIKGGPGSGGFLEGGADEQLSSIFDYSTLRGNHGWGELRDLLESEGFECQQVVEGAGGSTPVDLAGMDLGAYSVIVFGSNNAAYGVRHVDALVSYVRSGGAALFISDANWGLDWNDAPDSDQHFLDRFGWTMNQDRGHYALSSGEYAAPDHPILSGVSSFEGEGVSPITITDRTVPGVSTIRLAGAKGQVRRNTTSGQGPSTPATADDCSLVMATVGAGRIAGHFDRNTFFNRNGAGTDLHDRDHRALARNLFAWLATSGMTSPAFRRGDVNADAVVDLSDAIRILVFLFGETLGPILCHDAADVNDDGAIDLADPVFLLAYLFGSGLPIPAPSPECGTDPTPDDLECTAYEYCR